MFYFVASPIGNLGDITLRAKEVLGEVDYILTEDTRRSAILLGALNIKKRMVSFNQHSGHKIGAVVNDLKNGKHIALLSDAGTPGLCDPGGVLADAMIRENIEFTALPGPSSLATLVSLAPFPCSNFLFMGYFPKKKGRQKIIGEISAQERPVFFFESSHRIKKTLELLKDSLPDHRIFIGRELTKKFEQLIFSELVNIDINEVKEAGEFIFALLPPCQMKKNNT